MKIERQLQATLIAVFTELIKEKGLTGRIHPYPSQEEHYADITLKNKNGNPIFFIELKDPTAKDGKSVFDGNVLMREVERAQKIEIKYFGNCNFLACAFFDKDKLYEKVSVHEGFFTINDILRLSANYVPNKEIENKLRHIAGFYIDRALEILDRKPIKFSDIDELFIFKIRKLIEVYAHPISNNVWHKYTNDKQFEKKIQRYAQSQLWNKPSTYEEIENLSHIALLMLISKLIFYKTYVDNQTWHELHPMKVNEGIFTAMELEALIWQYFETFKEITGNFELLIGQRADIVFQLPFVSEAIIDLVKDVLDTGGHYNFSHIPFDIIGRIFEELIRDDERHKLGQYFTPPYVIDFINAFAIHKGNDKVFDPSCGSGTFLVRAYERKKNLCIEENKGARHEILLNEIYGNDLSGYPAYLSMLNLAIRNTRKPSYPRISNKDFFAITANGAVPLHDQHGKLEKKPLPKFDAIIGNPPYTRQEDIGTMHGTQNKDKIQALIKSECGFEPSARTSIYAYFFYHASVFLKEEGYLAFIVQNSWLDTDYGIDLQRYLMRNYEIIAIMDSEVERFFPSASVNTSIVIARKQKDESKRNNNIIKFVYFTAPLAGVIKLYKGVDSLYDAIQLANDNISNKHFKLNCIKQQTLAQHTKWGKFLKAPQVYFNILEKGKGKFVSLNTEADVVLQVVVNNIERFTTVKQIKSEELSLVENGFNELWLIESRFLKPMLTSPKDANTYSVKPSDLPYSILLINEEKKELQKHFPYVFKYIYYYEKQNIHLASSLAARKKWYSLGDKQLPDMSFNYIVNEFGRTFFVKAFSNNNFHNIYAKTKAKSIWLYMNSTISWLMQQLIMRSNLGDGAGKIETYELADFPIIPIDLENMEIDLGKTRNYKEELGSLDNLGTVNPDRLKLDDAILTAIGYNNKEERDETLLELYKGTYQLIEARLQKAQSMKGVKSQRNKVEFSVYIQQLKTMLIEGKYVAKNTTTFSKQVEKLVSEITSESKLQKKIIDTYWKGRFGELFNEKNIIKKNQMFLF
jgi:hypothetical protein